VFSRRKIRNLQCLKPLLDPWPGTAGTDLGESLKQKREHTHFHIGLNPPGQPVIHRGHLDPGPLERPEASLDDHQPLVTTGGVFETDGIIICLKHLRAWHPFPVWALNQSMIGMEYLQFQTRLKVHDAISKLHVTKPDIFCKLDRLYSLNQAAGNAYTGACVKR
jgi:hypothetical protein